MAKTTAVVTFGKFNVFSAGHKLLVDTIANEARKRNADMRVYLSHDVKPVPYDEKLKWAKKSVPKYRDSFIRSNARNIFDVLVDVYDAGYREIVVVVGSDRISEFSKLIPKYNGLKARHGFYEFTDIDVVVAGEARSDAAEGVAGISSTKLRKAAQDGDFELFASGVSNALSDRDKQQYFEIVKKSMRIRESAIVRFRDFVTEKWVGTGSFLKQTYEVFKDPSPSELNSIESYRESKNVRAIISPRGEAYVFDEDFLHAQAMDDVSEILWGARVSIHFKMKAITFSIDETDYKAAKESLLASSWIKRHCRGFLVIARDLGDKFVIEQNSSIEFLQKYGRYFTEDVELTEKVSRQDLSQVETYLDKLFAKVGVDVEFTKHFLERINDPRNVKPITTAEIIKLFRATYKKYGKIIPSLGKDAQAVLKDMVTDINVPFVLKVDKNGELDLISKTVMRKKGFQTSNQVLAVEDSFTDELKRIAESIIENK